MSRRRDCPCGGKPVDGMFCKACLRGIEIAIGRHREWQREMSVTQGRHAMRVELGDSKMSRQAIKKRLKSLRVKHGK